MLRAYKALPADAGVAFLAALADACGVARPGPDASRGLWMDWDMLRAMRNAGMTVGGHTVTHPVLARATPEQQRAEIAGCARRLLEELGEPMRCFAYPVGQPDSFDATNARLPPGGRRRLRVQLLRRTLPLRRLGCAGPAPRGGRDRRDSRPVPQPTVTLPWLFRWTPAARGVLHQRAAPGRHRPDRRVAGRCAGGAGYAGRPTRAPRSGCCADSTRCTCARSTGGVQRVAQAQAFQEIAANMYVDAESEATIRLLHSWDVPFMLMKGDRPAGLGRVALCRRAADRRRGPAAPRAAVMPTWERLRAGGWPLATDPGKTPPGHYHPPPLRGPSGISVELHGSTASTITPQEAWRRHDATATRLRWRGLDVRIPSTTELFWQAMVHAAMDGHESFRLRYFLDAAVLMAAAAADRLGHPQGPPRRRWKPGIPRSPAPARGGGAMAGTPVPAALDGPVAAFELSRAITWRLRALAGGERSGLRGRLIEEGDAGRPGTGPRARRRECRPGAARPAFRSAPTPPGRSTAPGGRDIADATVSSPGERHFPSVRTGRGARSPAPEAGPPHRCRRIHREPLHWPAAGARIRGSRRLARRPRSRGCHVARTGPLEPVPRGRCIEAVQPTHLLHLAWSWCPAS